MIVSNVESLHIPDVKLITFSRFPDNRGYFTETYNMYEAKLPHPRPVAQINESSSCPEVARGMHFQWDGHMGKLVRVLRGSIYDYALDIRIGSPTFGQAMTCHLSAPGHDMKQEKWLWIPAGFAHGFYTTFGAHVQYICDAVFNQYTDSCIDMCDKDIHWVGGAPLWMHNSMDKNVIRSSKDMGGMSLEAWKQSPNSINLDYTNSNVRASAQW